MVSHRVDLHWRTCEAFGCWNIKEMTLKRWIVVGLVVAAITIALAAFTGRSSGPIFSVRVVRLTHNALVEITNNTSQHMKYSFQLGSSTYKWEPGHLYPHQGRVVSIPAYLGDALVYGVAEHRFVRSRSWWARQYVNTLKMLGAPLFVRGEIRITMTNRTEWIHSEDVRLKNL